MKFLDFLKGIVVSLVALFIRDKQQRKAFRRRYKNFRFCDVPTARQFAAESPRGNAVLLVEENASHGEVISGYLPYFQELGYRVDVLVNTNILRERPFERHDMSDVNVYHCWYGAFERFIESPRAKRYAHVVLMSSAGYKFLDGNDASSIVAAQPAWGRLKSLLVVEHELSDLDRFDEGELAAQGRILTLGRFKVGTYVCPMRFGKVSYTPRNQLVTFVCVGALTALRRDYCGLFSAIADLDARGLDFKVVLIGRGDCGKMPEAVRRHVEVKGPLDFPAMFACVERADFYLPLLDHGNPDHERYVSTGVTGSAQLIYAFAKVPVIDPYFAPFYGFNSGNAILASDLSDGMCQAISMCDGEYARHQDALVSLTASLQRESLANLRRALQGRRGND